MSAVSVQGLRSLVSATGVLAATGVLSGAAATHAQRDASHPPRWFKPGVDERVASWHVTCTSFANMANATAITEKLSKDKLLPPQFLNALLMHNFDDSNAVFDAYSAATRDVAMAREERLGEITRDRGVADVHINNDESSTKLVNTCPTTGILSVEEVTLALSHA